MKLIITQCVITLFGIFATAVNATNHLTSEQLEKWFNDDLKSDEERALAVNEGSLVFLSKQPEKAVHYSQNILTISKDSLNSGWVSLKQCHINLDAVALSQIVYRYKRMRYLKVDSSEGIKRSWVDEGSVQLEGVQRGAKLCVQADVGILYIDTDGSAVLRNGPFHRKFLDGYYPMRVSLEIIYPEDMLRYESFSPLIQPGLSVVKNKNSLHVDALFEGELRTEVRFSRVGNVRR